VRDAQVFAGGGQAQPDPPVQPAHAIARPTVADVELGEQLEESAGGGGQVRLGRLT
jgi:hypothetical protein